MTPGASCHQVMRPHMLRLVRQGVGRNRRFRSEFIARERPDPGKGAPRLSLTARSSLDAHSAGAVRHCRGNHYSDSVPLSRPLLYHRLGGDGLDPDWIAASGGHRSSGRGEAAGETEAHLSCLPTVQSGESDLANSAAVLESLELISPPLWLFARQRKLKCDLGAPSLVR